MDEATKYLYRQRRWQDVAKMSKEDINKIVGTMWQIYCGGCSKGEEYKLGCLKKKSSCNVNGIENCMEATHVPYLLDSTEAEFVCEYNDNCVIGENGCQEKTDDDVNKCPVAHKASDIEKGKKVGCSWCSTKQDVIVFKKDGKNRMTMFINDKARASIDISIYDEYEIAAWAADSALMSKNIDIFILGDNGELC